MRLQNGDPGLCRYGVQLKEVGEPSSNDGWKCRAETINRPEREKATPMPSSSRRREPDIIYTTATAVSIHSISTVTGSD